MLATSRSHHNIRTGDSGNLSKWISKLKPSVDTANAVRLGLYVMYEGFVPTGRQIWFCADHKPDFRALRIAHLQKSIRTDEPYFCPHGSDARVAHRS